MEAEDRTFILLTAVYDLCAIAIVILAIRKNLKRGIRFQFSYMDYLTFAAGITPALIMTGQMLQDEEGSPISISIAYALMAIVAGTCGMALAQCSSLLNDNQRPRSNVRNVYVLLLGALGGYLTAILVLFSMFLITFRYG